MPKIKNTLTISEKIKLLEDVENGQGSTKQLAAKYKINKATVNRIKKNKDLIRESANSTNLQRKRTRQSRYGNLEDALSNWLAEMKEQNVEITRFMANKKVLEFARQLKVNVYPGSSWIWRWFRRVNFDFAKTGKESNDIPNADEQSDEVSQEDFECSNKQPKIESYSSDDNLEFVNDIEIDDGKTLLLPERIKDIKNVETTETNGDSSSYKNIEKHRWLGDLVVTQMEEVHPNDRADFAWEIHKLIRKFQTKRNHAQAIEDLDAL